MQLFKLFWKKCDLIFARGNLLWQRLRSYKGRKFMYRRYLSVKVYLVMFVKCFELMNSKFWYVIRKKMQKEVLKLCNTMSPVRWNSILNLFEIKSEMRLKVLIFDQFWSQYLLKFILWTTSRAIFSRQTFFGLHCHWCIVKPLTFTDKF